MQVEEFLIFESELSALQSADVGGAVNVFQRLGERHKVVFLDNLGRKRVGNAAYGIGGKQIVDELLHGAIGERAIAQCFGEIIHAAQAAGEFGLAEDIYFGVHYAVNALVERWLAENHIFNAGAIAFLNLFHAIEPHTFYCARSVGEKGIESAFGTFALWGEIDETPFELNVRHIALQVGDVVNGASVDVAKREIIQQVVERVNVELLGEQLGTLGSHAREVFYFRFSQLVHCLSRYSAIIKSLGCVIFILLTSPSTR